MAAWHHGILVGVQKIKKFEGGKILTRIPIHMEARTFSEKGRTFNLAQKR
jgi:hypothetical protein